MELDGFSQMRLKIIRIVTARIKMELVRDAFRGKLFMHLLRALLKPEIVLLPAVDIDGLRLDLDFVPAGQLEGIVLLPMRNVDRIAENIAK